MMIIHLGWMLPSTSSGYLGTRRATSHPHLPCSRRGLPSSISHLMDWCAFTAPFHLYNALRRCSLLSVALSIASPLLGVTQHPALRSPDFPHPDGNTTIETRPSTQLKPFYYTSSNNLITTKSEYPYQFEIVCQFDYGGGIFKSLQIFSTSHLPISLWRGTEVEIWPPRCRLPHRECRPPSQMK